MARPTKERKDKPLSVRIPPGLMAKIKEAAEKMEEGDQDTMRLAMRIGLEQLKRIDYKISKAVIDSADS